MKYGRYHNGKYVEADMTGWKEVVCPEYDSRYQRLVGPVDKDTHFEYTIDEIPINDIRPSILWKLKDIREKELDKMVTSAGVSSAYETNIKAADAVINGTASETEMWEGVMAIDYAERMATEMEMNVTTWATWIRDENKRERDRGMLIEQQYVKFMKALQNSNNSAAIVEYPDMDSETSTFSKFKATYNFVDNMYLITSYKKITDRDHVYGCGIGVKF